MRQNKEENTTSPEPIQRSQNLMTKQCSWEREGNRRNEEDYLLMIHQDKEKRGDNSITLQHALAYKALLVFLMTRNER